MRYKLRTKISMAFFAIAVVLFLFVSLMANYFLREGFRTYVLQKIDSESNALVDQVKNRYNPVLKKWDANGIESIGIGAMERGMLLNIVDSDGASVWDARKYNNGYCSQMLSHMEMNMMSQNKSFLGKYTEKSYLLKKNDLVMGTLVIGYYGPYYYSDNDLQYLKTLNTVLLIAGVLALLLSVGMGFLIARHLTLPIRQVVQNAQKISKGDFKSKIVQHSGTEEIQELTEAINEMGDELERQEELKKQLSSDIAHELRTPVTSLQSHLELMTDGIWEPTSERLKSCYEESVRLGNLINELSKVHQMERNEIHLNKEKLDLKKVVEDILTAVEGNYFQKGVSLDKDLQECELSADQDKIKQILMNLLNNGLNYTPKGGAVFVRLQCLKDGIELSVKDTGIGIPAEELPKIFERFYRVDKSRNRDSGGNGIGLAIVKSFVKAHNGEISVQSELGKGSTFSVFLPK